MDPKIIFRAIDHSYWLGSGPIENRTKLRSVNTLWGSYMQKFDDKLGHCTGALAYVMGYSKFWKSYWPRESDIDTEEDLRKYYGEHMGPLYEELKRVVANEWDYGNVLGTDLHNTLENRSYEDGYAINPFNGLKYKVWDIMKDHDNQTIVDDLFDLEDGCYPELVVFHEPSLSCGQVDMPFIRTEDGIRYVSILDSKTNGGVCRETGLGKRNDIEKINKKYLKGGGFLECTGPLKGLPDCTKTKYQGQVSMYGACLEEAGYIVEHVGIEHFLEYDVNQGKIIKYDYLGERAKSVLRENSFC